MSDQDRITSIINAIQTDTNLLILLRALVSANIINVPTDKLIMAQTVLGLPTS